MKTFILLSSLLLSWIAAAEPTLPKGCEPLQLDQSLVIKGTKVRLVFIHNLSFNDVWLTHPVTNPGANAGWTTRLQPEHWSVLVVNKDSFTLNCTESRPGHEQELACAGLIAACQWPHAKIPSEQKGTFWAAEDMTLNVLTAALGGRGFKLAKT